MGASMMPVTSGESSSTSSIIVSSASASTASSSPSTMSSSPSASGASSGLGAATGKTSLLRFRPLSPLFRSSYRWCDWDHVDRAAHGTTDRIAVEIVELRSAFRVLARPLRAAPSLDVDIVGGCFSGHRVLPRDCLDPTTLTVASDVTASLVRRKARLQHSAERIVYATKVWCRATQWYPTCYPESRAKRERYAALRHDLLAPIVSPIFGKILPSRPGGEVEGASWSNRRTRRLTATRSCSVYWFPL